MTVTEQGQELKEQTNPSEERIGRLRMLYGSFGYLPFRMSNFEEYDLYVRNKNFLVSDNVITFTDTNGKLMALKPDVTLSIVKNTEDTVGVRKVYYNENVYRPSSGSRTFSEIPQMGLECIGELDDYCLAEVLYLAAKSLYAISDDFVLDVSHLGLLLSVMDRVGVSQEARRDVLRCIGEKNRHELDRILRDDGLSKDRIALLFCLLDCGGTVEESSLRLPKLYADEEWQAQVSAFIRILTAFPLENVRVDFSVINDMSYYNGMVFSGFVNGIPSSILSGGQYDPLIRRMGKTGRAAGFALYLDKIEEHFTVSPAYDLDTVLLYDDQTNVTALSEAVRQIACEGRSVQALKALPVKLKCRCVLRINEKGEVVPC